ncbi:MAG TPA: iron chelate uptake ABC transporter family permease subunit, partial [Clostridia bacterium]|nr:iron chelate uptake ABC transporter family permease subunit [Clostridia bacterium]
MPAALVLCAAALLLCVCVGSVRVDPAVLWKVLTNRTEGIPATQVAIVQTIRLPRVLMAFCIGAALSVSGAVMQSVLRNALASGYTMGVSSGASLGAGIAMFAGWNALGRWTLPALGLTGGMLTVFLAVMLAVRMDKRMQSHTIVLTGMVFSLFV